MIMDCAEDTRRSCKQYIEALEEERRKIQVFHRELPLSLYIVSQAIDSCKQQMATESLDLGRSDCEETSSDEHPVLEEFIPIKGRSVSSEKEEETREREGKRPDWLRSVQLWNQNSDPPADEESPRKPAAVAEIKKVGGAFHPFRAEKKMEAAPAVATSSSAAGTGSRSRPREEKELRKARRCWSPELHRRFLNALQQLGGPDVATPKQIKELMKVDGLTNDEVKSHLQKYRLHTRRPGASIHGSSTSTEPRPQLVVVGGIWVPPPEYAMVTKSMETTPVYAPVPSPLPQKEEEARQSPAGPLQWMMGRCSLDEDHANSSNSPATSSSSHTTTTSPSPAI